MRIRKILTLFLFSLFVISALLSGCNSSPQSQSGSKTNAAQNKQETNTTDSYSVTDLTGTKITDLLYVYGPDCTGTGYQ